MILAIDLGQKTTGLAISQGMIAVPFKTISHESQSKALSQIIRIIEEEQISVVVIGFVEGKIKKLFVDFAQKLREKKPDIEIVMWDETLTTGQAQEFMIKLGTTRNKRRIKEHEIAAAIILQSFLDSK